MSVADLAKRLGVTVETASALELRDEQGAAESGEVEQALEALGLARWDVVLSKEELAAIEKNARDIAKRTAWTMELEGQRLPQSQIEEIVAVLVARGVASLDATANLLSSPENAKRLLRSIKEIKSGGRLEAFGAPGNVERQEDSGEF